MFVNRTRELQFFDTLLTRKHPGPAQLVLLYGRRRVGKTGLLRHWAGQNVFAPGVASTPDRVSYTYWSAEKEPAALQRRRLYAKLLDIGYSRAPIFASWRELWSAVADLLRARRIGCPDSSLVQSGP